MFVKLALDENGNVKVTEDGKPIFLDNKDKEVPVDVPAMYQKILDLGSESKTNREKLDELKQTFSVLDDVEDVPAWVETAKKAIEQVENFNDKDWMKVEKVDSLKRQMKEAQANELKQVKAQFETTITDQVADLEKKDGIIRKLMVGNKFAVSPLFAGKDPKTSMTPDVAEAFFGNHFRVEEDEKNNNAPVVRAYFSNGDPVISASPERVGELANFDEAIQIIFDQYPNRDMYIPTSGKGSGAGGGGGGPADDDDMSKLQAQYAEAQKTADTATMISLKNKMNTLRAKQQGRAA